MYGAKIHKKICKKDNFLINPVIKFPYKMSLSKGYKNVSEKGGLICRVLPFMRDCDLRVRHCTIRYAGRFFNLYQQRNADGLQITKFFHLCSLLADIKLLNAFIFSSISITSRISINYLLLLQFYLVRIKLLTFS